MAQQGNNISRTKSSLPDVGFMAYVITFAITFRPASITYEEMSEASTHP